MNLVNVLKALASCSNREPPAHPWTKRRYSDRVKSEYDYPHRLLACACSRVKTYWFTKYCANSQTPSSGIWTSATLTCSCNRQLWKKECFGVRKGSWKNRYYDPLTDCRCLLHTDVLKGAQLQLCWIKFWPASFVISSALSPFRPSILNGVPRRDYSKTNFPVTCWQWMNSQEVLNRWVCQSRSKS